MDQRIYASVEKILANASIASVRSWLRARGKKFSAGSREQLVERVAAQIEKQDLTFGELENAIIGIEETGAKLIFLFEIDGEINSAKVKANLSKLGVTLKANREIATPVPVKPKMIYAKLDGDAVRGSHLQSNTRSEAALHRGEQAKEESKHYPAAYTPRLHKSNRFNDNEFLVWALVSGALITISGSVLNTATLLEVLAATNIAPISGLDPANA